MKICRTWRNEIGIVVGNQSLEKHRCYAQCEKRNSNELDRDQSILMKSQIYKKQLALAWSLLIDTIPVAQGY